MIILKLDFKKAFDKIEYEVILHIMQHKGFDSKMAYVDEDDHELRDLFHFAEWHSRQGFLLQEVLDNVILSHLCFLF
jgi:hypothetical protein